MLGDDEMKVFVSWSGEISQKFAEFLKEWLEQCIQSVEVFFSAEDIEKGDNWQSKLSNELRDANYGIVCLTPENIDAPWIHFEAGALSKMLDSKVMVLAVNINFSDIKGPLKVFQATKLTKDDIFKMLKSINNVQEKPLGEEKLKNSFEAFWPQLDDKIKEMKGELTKSVDDKKASTKPNVSNIVDEILQLVRNQNAILNDPSKLLPTDYLEYALRKNSFLNGNEDRLFDELYSFTRGVFNRYPDLLVLPDFVEDYRVMIDRICVDNVPWRRRFSRLFFNIKKLRDNSNEEEEE